MEVFLPLQRCTQLLAAHLLTPHVPTLMALVHWGCKHAQWCVRFASVTLLFSLGVAFLEALEQIDELENYVVQVRARACMH